MGEVETLGSVDGAEDRGEMIHDIISLFLVAAFSFLISLLFWNRREQDFSAWWRSQGMLIFTFAVIILIAILCARGCFQSRLAKLGQHPGIRRGGGAGALIDVWHGV